jgi:hypothetical protein
MTMTPDEANRQSPGDAQCHVTLLLARAEKAEAELAAARAQAGVVLSEENDALIVSNAAKDARIAELERNASLWFDQLMKEVAVRADRDRQIAALREALLSATSRSPSAAAAPLAPADLSVPATKFLP